MACRKAGSTLPGEIDIQYPPGSTALQRGQLEL
jgi:hypothetical protein